MRFISIGLIALAVILFGWPLATMRGKVQRVRSLRRAGPSWSGLLKATTRLRDALILATFALMLSVVITPGFLLNSTLTLRFQFDSFVQGIGLLLLALGSSLGVWAVRTMREYGTEEILIAENHPLVQTGPYKKVRHPMYGSALLMGLGTFLFYLNLIFLLLALTIFGVNIHRARVEEKLLASPQGFGEQYQEYRKQTRMFIPYLF